MHITELPEDILIIIIRLLDIKSQENLYSSSPRIRDLVRSSPVIKECHLSMNTLATANTLKSNFFFDISEHLRELNLCNVTDLDKESLLQAMRFLKSLETLDITFTHLDLSDLPDIHEMCPTLRNISIDFWFSQRKTDFDTFTQCQSVLEHFQNVHFAGSYYNLAKTPKLAFFILGKSKLSSLKFTTDETRHGLADYSKHIYLCRQKLPQFNEFSIQFLHSSGLPIPCHLLQDIIESENYVIIIIVVDLDESFNNIPYYCRYTVYASSSLHSFFIENFNVEAKDITDKFLNSSVAMMRMLFWNIQTTKFDDSFLCEVRKRVREYLPYTCTAREIPAPKGYDWFQIIPKQPDMMATNQSSDEDEPAVKRNRKENHILNYDTIFKDKSRVQLKLTFPSTIPTGVTLTPDCGYLRKLTYLSIIGDVEYSPEFFKVLFQCCSNLVTLNVSSFSCVSCSSSIADSISSTQSLKNFNLHQRSVSDVEGLIISLCKCPTLETILINGPNVRELKGYILMPLIKQLLKNCPNLYSLYIVTSVDNTYKERLQMLNEIANLNKRYLSISIQSSSTAYLTDNKVRQFIDVFKTTLVPPFLR